MGNFLNIGDVPAWLQAFAAIVALGISVWVVRQAGSVERRKSDLEAKGIAVAIYPDLLKLETTISDTRGSVELLKKRDRVLIAQAIAHTESTQINVPPMLERNIDKLFLLGEPAGPSCLHLVNLLWQYNSFVRQVAARAIAMDRDQWLQAIGYLDQHLTLLSEVTRKCLSSVKPIHDSIHG